MAEASVIPSTEELMDTFAETHVVAAASLAALQRARRTCAINDAERRLESLLYALESVANSGTEIDSTLLGYLVLMAQEALQAMGDTARQACSEAIPVEDAA